MIELNHAKTGMLRIKYIALLLLVLYPVFFLLDPHSFLPLDDHALLNASRGSRSTVLNSSQVVDVLNFSKFTRVNQDHKSMWKQLQEERKARRSRINEEIPVEPRSTLALLFPPGLLDGYRNQAMRFIALVAFAKKGDLKQLFLPSLLWSTQLESISSEVHGSPIPMEWVFDIDYWNSFAQHLPVIISDLPHSDCWVSADDMASSVYWPSNWSALNALQQEALSRGTFRNIINTTVGYITKQLAEKRPRKLDLLPDIQSCQEPRGYGGGLSVGHLWADYFRFMKAPAINGSVAPFQVDKWVLLALRPAPVWREVARQCVEAGTHGTGNYIAVHARVELDMLNHICGKYMEQNLTTILQRVENLAKNLSSVNSAFLAISRYGLEIKNYKYKLFRSTADDNLNTYYRTTGYNHTKKPSSGIGSADFPVFQCGEPALSKFYDANPDVPDHGYLLHSVLDFEVAVNAYAFVGPSWGSTFTRDVWITRYHMGKGDQNYQYTKDGVEKVGNDGLPDLHNLC